MSDAHINFVKQQGFERASAPTCDFQYPALMFQPRLIPVIVLAAVILQSPSLYLALSCLLWWNVLVPALNPFDWLYNRLVATRKGVPKLTVAPAPRRFAQGMAATFMLVIGVSLLAGWTMLAWVFQALLLVAIGALVLGAFCLGSFIFHLVSGNGAFARRTLPWAQGGWS